MDRQPIVSKASGKRKMVGVILAVVIAITFAFLSLANRSARSNRFLGLRA